MDTEYRMKELLTYHSKNAELSLLNWIIQNDRLPNIKADCFYLSDHREAFDQIREQYKATGKIELSALSEKNIDTILSGDDIRTPRNSEPLVQRLYDCLQAREMALASIKAVETIQSSPDTIKGEIEALASLLSRLCMRGVGNAYRHEKQVAQFLFDIREAKDSDHRLKGISTNGKERLDHYLQGWQKAKTYIIGGMQKLGKSRFCLDLTSDWLQKGIGGIWFSMEMRENDIYECIIANRSNVNSNKYYSSQMSSQEYKASEKAIQRFINEPLYIDTSSSITPEYIRAMIQKQKIQFRKANKNCVFVVVDYIQRMVDGDNKANKLEDVAKSLADIARDEDVIMIVISQLNSEAEKNDGTLSPDRFIKGSKGIREAADSIIVLYQTADQKKQTDESCSYMLANIIQRKGVSGIDIPLMAQLQYSRFRTMSEVQNEDF